MRTIPIIILAAAIISCASSLPPAGPAGTVMKQADRIILTFDEDPERVFLGVKQHLLDNGFAIQRSNNNQLTLQTGYRQFGPTVLGMFGSYKMRLFTSVKDSTIHFRGQLNGNAEIENAGTKNSQLKSSWQQMVKIAKDYPHKKLYYSRN